MSFKLFDVVSIEEQTQGTTSFDVMDAVSMEDTSYGINIVADEVVGQIAAMESSIEAATNLDIKIGIEEAIVASGNVSAGIAQMAMVSLQQTAALVGINPSKFAISNESMESNPTTAVKISIESAKETFKAIIEKIKLFFSRVWSNIKKIAAKAMLLVTDYSKVFKNLEEKARKISKVKEEDAGKLSESDIKKLLVKDFAAIYGNEGKVSVKTMADFTLVDTVAKYVGNNADVKAEDVKVSGVLDNVKFVDGAEKSYDGIPKLGADEKILISRIDGDMIKGEVFSFTKVAKPEHMVINFRPFTAKAKSDLIKNGASKVKLLTKDEIITLATEGYVLAEDLKVVVKNTDEMLKATEKALGSAKESTVEEDKEALNKAHSMNISRLSTATLRHSTNILLGYIGGLKNKASIISTHMSKYAEAEK